MASQIPAPAADSPVAPSRRKKKSEGSLDVSTEASAVASPEASAAPDVPAAAPDTADGASVPVPRRRRPQFEDGDEAAGDSAAAPESADAVVSAAPADDTSSEGEEEGAGEGEGEKAPSELAALEEARLRRAAREQRRAARQATE